MQRLFRWLLVCAVLLTVALPAWAAPRIDMVVQPANEGRVKQEGRVTLYIDLTNQGGESTGELTVELDDDYPHAQYVVPFALPAGTKKRIPVTLQPEVTSPLVVRLRSGGELIAEKRVELSWFPYGTPMIGVLSSDELGIPALNQFQAGSNRAGQVVRLDATTLGDNAGLLDQFDVIALSRFDSSSLSKEQLRALEVWVGRGGTLLLAGGPEWRRTIAPLPASLVPVEVTEVRSVSLAPLGEVTDKPLAEQGAVSVAQLRGAQATISSDGVPLVATASVGAGHVIFLAFDPGLTPLVGWGGQVTLFNRLLGGVGADQGAAQWFGNQSWQIEQALRRLPEWVLPGLGSMVLLLLGYLLLIGPVNYLVLKRFDKREWAWISLPALSLLFVGGFYLAGFGRFDPVVSHLITLTELSPGTGTGTTTSYLGVYAPGKERFEVPVQGAGFIKPFQMGGGRMTGRVVMGDRTTVEFLSMSNTAMSGFTMEQDIAIPGGIELADAQLAGRVLTGQLKNRLDRPVDGLAISVGLASQVIGRLEPGGAVPFSLSLDNIDSAMMQNRFGFPTPSVDEGETPDGERRSMVRGYLFSQITQQASSGIVISGWVEEPFQAASFGNTGKLVQGTNLVYELLPLPVGGQSVEIPAGLIQGYPLDAGMVDRFPNGYMLRPGTVNFGIPLPVLDATKVAAVEVDLRQTNPDIKAYVLNHKSGELVPIPGQSLTLEPWGDFVTSLGLIEVQYETSQHIDIPAPTVTVKGVSR